VDTGKFIATANSIADSVFEKGLRNVIDGSAVFSTAGTDYQPTNLNAAISVEAGAEIRSAAGGDVLLIAPRVVNQGRIDTPQGQAVLAAGDKVYLMSSSDPRQRGLIVAVDPVLVADGRTGTSKSPDATLGTVENAANGSTDGLVNKVNEIHADSGTVNLVGLTVKQSGQINATTAVKGANGAIYLQAMASTAALNGDPKDTNGAALRGLTGELGSQIRVGAQLGTVQIGDHSTTAVLPSSSAATQLDAESYYPSRIRIEAAAITVGRGAQVLAPAGQIDLRASADATASLALNVEPGVLGTKSDGSRIVIAPDAVLSVAGLQNVAVDGARNQGAQRLFRIELADSALARDSKLYRSQVYFNLRDASKVAVANVTGSAAAIGRTAAERATVGGSIKLLTDGALVVNESALLDVSGGSVRYGQATVSSSLLSQDGRVVTFAKALGSRTVDGLYTAVQQTSLPAYTEGANGGTLTLSARQMALAGTLQGRTTLGDYQRDGTATAATPAALNLGLRNDTTFALGTLQLLPSSAAGPSADWLQSPLTASAASLPVGIDLSLAQVASGGFGQLRLRASQLLQPRYASLDLGPRGVLDIEAGTAQLDGAYRAAGGTLTVTTLALSQTDRSLGELTVSGRSVLDAAGNWTNDTAAAASAAEATTAIATNGGNVNLKASRTLAVEAGARLDVSGGAWLKSSGTATSGKAGVIGLNAGAGATLQIDGATLAGFDFGSGGVLTLGTTTGLTIADAVAPTGLTLLPSFFSASGFGTVTVNAAGAVRLASGTTVAPHLHNWQWTDAWRQSPSGALRDGAAEAVTLDTTLVDRKPVSLSFVASGGDAVVERGAAVRLDPGASFSLSSGSNLLVGASGGQPGQPATVSVPGGSISLSVTGQRSNPVGDDAFGFVPSQALWLGADAHLSVDGTAQLRRDAGAVAQLQFNGSTDAATPLDQRRVGTVWGGGTIALNAARGYVVGEAGSTMSLNGASATLNFAGLPQAVTVAKAAGSLTVSTPEGFALEGSVSAQAPRNAAREVLADGGRLSLSVGRYGVYSGTNSPINLPYDTSPRTLALGTDALRLAGQPLIPGATDLTTLLGNGTGFVRSGLLKNSGWSGLNLGAGDLVRFDQSLSLALPLGLVLDTPAIAAAQGVQVAFIAGKALVGDASLGRIGNAPATVALADPAADGSTALHISAPTVDVYGNLGLQGFSRVTLDAGAARGGEVRFSAASPRFGFDPTLQRTLNFSGTLALIAGQVYATSTTQYTLAGLDGSRLSVQRPPGNEDLAAPLSAYGSLTARATDIDQGGTLRQPFGALKLAAAHTLTLSEGSITSTSGDGATVLYGQTLNLSTWQLPGRSAPSFLPDDAKSISLSANQLVTAPSALVSTRGGGTLRAWEFFPGVGGSSDYLATSDLYAILPDYAATQTLALDGGIVAGGAYGQQIVITQAGSGLAPGRYTLLPARYALLGDSLPQGAYLVSRAASQGNTLLRAPVRQDDGSVLLTGYFTSTGATTIGAPGERFVVEAAATYSAKSDVRQTDVSVLLQARAAAGQAVPALPRDAGTLTLAETGGAAGATNWQARLDLAPVGGRAGNLDVTAAQIALVDDLAKAPVGALGIRAATLAASGAGSVLLGGTRSAAASSTAACGPICIDSGGTRLVSVDIGSKPLVIEELLLGATESVTLAANTQLSASATGTLGARTLTSQGNGALMAVSANALTLQRTGASASASSGDLIVAAGSRLSGQQVSLDATGLAKIDPSVQLAAQATSLAARHLVIGAPSSADALATTVQGALLDALSSTNDLSLRAYTSIDFAGTQNWSQRPAANAEQPNPSAAVVKQRLTLDAPVLRGVDGVAPKTGVGTEPVVGTKLAAVDITAQEVVLRNSTGLVAQDGGAGSGTLLLQAVPPLRYGRTGGLTLGPGEVAADFSSVALRSQGDTVLQGSGGFTAQQDLQISAARLTATTGANQGLTAKGTLRIGGEAGSHTLGEQVGQGAKVMLTGATVAQDGVIDLPGADLTLRASAGDSTAATLAFGTGSRTSVAGFRFSGSDGSSADGAAGSLLARAEAGRIEVQGTLDASAARRADGSLATGDGGQITLQAIGGGGALVLGNAGRLAGQGGTGSGDLGGRLNVDVRTMAGADALAQAATAGGMTGAVALRVRSGDVALDSGLRAAQISLSADAGNLNIGAQSGSAPLLNARSDGGGVVQLAAGGNLALGAGSRIDAGNTASDGRGGDVLLASSDGQVRIAGSAVVSAGDAAGSGGRIVLRARRGDDDASVAVAPLNTTNLRASEVVVEAVRVYEGYNSIAAGSTSDTTLGQATVAQDNTAYMAQASTINRALGVSAADAGRVQLRAGVEVRTDGDLSVDSDWNLNASRPGGAAGLLTLRASGNLLVNSSLSDGFASVSRNAALNSDGQSWSLRLTAGADLGATLPTTVASSSADPGTASLTIGAGAVVRVGAGSIDMAAGRDVVFAPGDDKNAAGQAYVAGRALTGSAAPAASLFAKMQAFPQFTINGGRLTLSAGNDISAPEATQLINNWYWRSGLLNATDSTRYSDSEPLAWWTQFSRFGQTLGAFGGSSITAQAGHNITNLQAMAPSAGWADSLNADTAGLLTLGGGGVTVRAGADLLGGQFLLGQGNGRLEAGGAIGVASDNVNPASPILALNSGEWRVTARGNVTVAAPFNPTAAPASDADSRRGFSGYFYTWGADAGLTLQSKAGAAALQSGPDENSAIGLGLAIGQISDLNMFQVTTPSLRVSAAGDIALFEGGSGTVMFPSPQGQLALWSGGTILLSATSGSLAMADSLPATWGTARTPINPTANVVGASLVIGTIGDTLPLAALHADDATPVQVHAERSVEITGGSTTKATLLLAKPANISAGTDLVSLSTRVEHFSSSNVSHITAGRNLLGGEFGYIEVAGPGAIEVSAGRNIDLGSSGGITTNGNLRSAALPAQGASVRLSAATEGTLDVDVLSARYLTPADQGGSARAATYRAALLAFVRDALQQPKLDEATAWAQFKTFPSAAQARFGRQVLASEFGATYLTGPLPSTEQLTTTLQAAFERDKAQVLSAGGAALAAGQALTLPGRETLKDTELASYLAQLRGLSFASLDLDSAIAARLSQLTNLRSGWQQTVASALGDTVAGFAQRAAKNPADPAVLAYQAALADTSSTRFTRYRDQVLASELASTGGVAAQFGKLSLPMRLAFFEQGFQAAELAGVGNFTNHAVWTGGAPLLSYTGALDMTQSSVVTKRGGDISLVNPGGAITVGLKDTGASAAKGVITLGGGNIFGFARDDFQVNTQRVFVVGQGDMTLWSSNGDIDSGRGANTAVAAPPLAPRRSVDGVVFETPATTTGSGLGILEDASGRRSGTIGLFPAFGEILALDAFIRAPSVVLGSAIKGADNLQSPSVGGATAPVAAPALAAPPPASTESRAADAAGAGAAQSQESRPRNALLTVDLLGMGPASDETCDDKDKVDNKCPAPAAKPCSDADKAKGLCKPPGKAP